jgi:putative ABC transport system ATP-binding protein
MDHQPNQLSGGQRHVWQRRALVNKPSLLADEPTGNLDSKTSEEIWTFNDIHAHGNTVILVTQEEVAAYAHRIIRLRDGMVEKRYNK